MSALKYQGWEVSTIRELYPNIAEIRRRLPHRTVSAIKTKARELKVVTSRMVPNWSLDELKIIKRLYPDIDAICLAIPTRTRAAVLERIKKLGVGRRIKRWTPERRRLLREIYLALSDKELGDIFGVSANAVFRRRQSMRLLRPQKPSNENARVPIVRDIRQEARKRRLPLRPLTMAAGCHSLTPSAEYRHLAWGPVAKVVEALGGELYVQWDD